MSQSIEDLELFHYGVLGMKWGVRKDRGGKKGTIRSAIKKRDDNIKSARSKQVDAWKKEASAVSASVRTKGSLLKNPDDPTARSNAKSASKLRREASQQRREIDSVANKKTSKEIAIKGATYAVPVVLSFGYVATGALGTRKNAKVGAKLKSDIFSDTHGLPAPNTIALQYINGKWQ